MTNEAPNVFTDIEQLGSLNMTVADLVKSVIGMNAGIAQLKLNDNHEQPYVAVIVLNGRETCQEVLAAIEQIEAKWEGDRTNA